MDAWEDAGHDFGVVTRDWQGNPSQEWIIRPTNTGSGTYHVQQAVNRRYMDAWEDAEHDFSVVTREWQGNPSQEWIITHANTGSGTYHVQQVVNRRYMDAWEDAGHDFRVVTREWQGNPSQEWIITPSTSSCPETCYGKTCDFWGQHGYSCSVLSSTYRCDCSGCSCS